MAAGTRTRPFMECDIHDDHTHDESSRHHLEPPASVLGELPLSNIQNIKPAVEALAVEPGSFHPSKPVRKNTFDHRPPTRTRRRTSRPRVGFDIFQAPLATHNKERDSCDSAATASQALGSAVDCEASGLLAASIHELPSNAEQLSKHQAGQFEWLLSLPTMRHGSDSTRDGRCLDGDEKGLLFGCNLVRRKRSSEETLGNSHGNTADVFTLLATRVDGDDSGSADEVAALEEMSTTTTHADTTIIRMGTPQAERRGSERRTSEVALSAKNDDIVEQLIALPPASQTSRIEDSVEALDKLEEELEALNEVTHLKRVLSPETSKAGAAGQQSIDSSLKRACSTVKKSGASTVRVRSTADRSSSVHKSVSMTPQDEEKPAGASNSKAPRKSLVTRPASLRQPKPPAKSSKQPTIPTFELPGEVVARRLKEQRQARLSRQLTPEEAAVAAQACSPSKPHAKSAKQPTRPTFELPGEAISRRKREEREAKLRAQEEEERKRREFKARPIRASIVPSSYPRETIASRARQGKAQGEGEASSSAAGASTPGTVARKRQSMMAATTRGRSELAVGSTAGASRATSTSTGSIHGGGAGAGSVVSVSKRSTVSAEEQQQQKARGREIFARDNSIAAQRERERKDKEAAAKTARQEAAERSRQLSREWAEKQRKRMSMVGTPSS